MSITESSKATLELIKLAEEYVFEKLKNDLSGHFYFHNSEHTKLIYNAAKKLANAADLNNEDKEALLLASLFYYIGYTEGKKKYWKESEIIAKEFFKKNNTPEILINKISRLINLSGENIQPQTQLDKLFLDAIHSYFGKKSFNKRFRRLRKEEEEINGVKLELLSWQKDLLKKISNHVFYTVHGENLFGKRKLKNIKKLKNDNKQSLKIKAEREKMNSISANSGARTLFKTALRNHIDLTAIADQKANIMLSINALIITIGLPAFSTYLTGTSYLIIPAVIFLLTSVATMILATMSTRPIKMDGETDLSKLLTGKTNLFFFGNFYKLKREEYQGAIKKIVSDREYLDTSFTNDLFNLGLSLGDKYKLLRICYSVFVAGVSLSVLSFIVAYFVSTFN